MTLHRRLQTFGLADCPQLRPNPRAAAFTLDGTDQIGPVHSPFVRRDFCPVRADGAQDTETQTDHDNDYNHHHYHYC